MSLNNNTIPQTLYNTPDPFSRPSELYVIHGTKSDACKDPNKRWVIKEEHGYWDEATGRFLLRATTLLPNHPKHCMSLEEVFEEISKQVLRRVSEGFKYQLEWDPMVPPPFFVKYELSMDGARRMYE